MAGAFTQNSIDAGAEGFQNFNGHKCLDRAGKAAAVDTVSTLALQEVFAHSQGQGHILVLLVAGGDHIL